MKALVVSGYSLAIAFTSLGCGDSTEPGTETSVDAQVETQTETTPDVAAESTPDVPTSIACDPATDNDGNPVACVAGRIVDEAGAPVPSLAIGACTLDVCIRGTTNAEGRYVIGRLTVNPQKMLVFGTAKGYAQMIYYQDATAGVLSEAPFDVQVHRLAAPDTAWSATTGGTVSLAGGMLELTADADALLYPIGAEEKVTALEVDPTELPPYDIEPWAGKEAATRAFIVNPYPLHTEAGKPATLTVKGATGVTAGATYTVYSAHTTQGILEAHGTATADGNGAIVLEGGTLTDLTTLVIVPD